MTLRKHQAEMVTICQEILEGRPIKSIILAATPGGGKSSHPVILAENLIPTIADKLLWVVPRNSLKYQGESEFCEPHWGTLHRLRAIDGNTSEPSRGFSGYITTYQAIGMDPSPHLQEIKQHRYILFLDEPHHIMESGAWEGALRPLVERAVLVVYASGTLSRGDGQKIAFLDYRGVHVDLTDREHMRTIRYSRTDALRERAICPVRFITVDGSAEWENEDGSTGSADAISSAADDTAKAVFTALRTEYALDLLSRAAADWVAYKHDHYQVAKLLVVTPNIALAQQYNAYLQAKLPHHVGAIATSDDTLDARRNIEAFRRGILDYLVTCAMAYEGMSVREITHIACLTHIRSVPWLEQCFARGNRLAPGKTEAWIYAPADRNFAEAIRMIEDEQLVPLSEAPALDSDGALMEKAGTGEKKPWITPLRSSALDSGPAGPAPVYSPTAAISHQEETLRGQIREHKRLVISRRRPGATRSMRRVLEMMIRRVVDKPLSDMTVDELNLVWMKLRERYPV